eukprot:5696945-Pyramimonas_sp.AAC.1
MQEAWVYSHDGPFRCRKRGYIPMTNQSDAGNPTAGLDTNAVELTVKTLLSQLVSQNRNSPVDSPVNSPASN